MQLVLGSRRNRFALVVAAIAIVCAVVYFYRPWEPHYHWRPASWWAEQYRRVFPVAYMSSDESLLGLEMWRQPYLADRESPLALWLERLGLPKRSKTPADVSLLAGDPEALPVLVILLHNSDSTARRAAVRGLSMIGNRHSGALPALGAARSDEDPYVREEAERAFRELADAGGDR